MKFSISKPALENNLATVIRAKRRSTLLDGVFVEIQNGHATFSVTNNVTTIRTWTKVEDSEDGQAFVPVTEFFNLAQVAKKDKKITLASEGWNLRFRNGTTNTLLNGFDSTHFPVIPTAGEGGIIVERSLLDEFATRLVPFHQKGQRPILECVNILTKNSQMLAFTTDGFVMGSITRPTNLPDGLLLIDAETIKQEVAPVLMETHIKMFITPNSVIFRDSYSEIVCQMIESPSLDITPMLERVKNPPIRVSVSAGELRDMFRRLAIILPEADSQINVEIRDGQMIFSGESQRGKIDDSLICDHQGDNIALRLSILIARQMLAVVQENVVLEFISPNAPIKITCPNFADWTGVIMPIGAKKVKE